MHKAKLGVLVLGLNAVHTSLGSIAWCIGSHGVRSGNKFPKDELTAVGELPLKFTRGMGVYIGNTKGKNDEDSGLSEHGAFEE